VWVASARRSLPDHGSESKDSLDATDCDLRCGARHGEFTSDGDGTVVTPTLNPLVAMYSGTGVRRRKYASQVSGPPPDERLSWMTTNKLPCVDGRARNSCGGNAGETTTRWCTLPAMRHCPRHCSQTGAPPATVKLSAVHGTPGPGRKSDDSEQMSTTTLLKKPARMPSNQVATDLNGRHRVVLRPIGIGLVSAVIPASWNQEARCCCWAAIAIGPWASTCCGRSDLAGNPFAGNEY